MMGKWIMAALAVLLGGSALVANATVVLDSDFQSATTNDLLPLAVADRNIALDSGTTVGMWADNGVTPNDLYKTTQDEAGNKVLVFSSGNNNLTLADLDFSSPVSLAGSELSISWDWMQTDIGGGGSSQGIVQLLDSSDSVVATVLWQDQGALKVDGTAIGTLEKDLLGTSATVLSTNNWDPMSLQLDLNSVDLSVTVSDSGGQKFQKTIPVSYSEVAALRFKSTSNRSYRYGGMWIDNLYAEVSTASDPLLSLTPAEELAITLSAPDTTAVGTVDAQFVPGASGTNVQISALEISNSAFTSLDSFPLVLTEAAPSKTVLSLQFDNTVAGLTDGQSATSTVNVIWNELGSAVSATNSLTLVATYENSPTELLLNPADSLGMVVAAPETTTTDSFTVRYTERTAYPTNVILTDIQIVDQTHPGVFSTSTSPFTLNDPAPSNGMVDVAFDATGFVSGETATGVVAVSWMEVDGIVTNQSLLPVVGTYHDLAPASGTIIHNGNSYFNASNIVFGTGGSVSGDSEAKGVKRQGIYDASTYAKLGQEISGSALTNGAVVFNGLVLRIGGTAYNLSASSGANQLQIWFGKINSSNGEPVETYAVETFDCSGRNYPKWNWYQFDLSAPVTFNPDDLSSNEAFAYQLWWTVDDPANNIGFARTKSINKIDGGSHHESDLTASDTTFPVTMDAREENRDLQFALVNNGGAIPDIGEITVVMDGTNMVMGWPGAVGTDYLVLSTENLVTGSWATNVVPGVDGAMSVTNDTTDPKAFYKVIVE